MYYFPIQENRLSFSLLNKQEYEVGSNCINMFTILLYYKYEHITINWLHMISLLIISMISFLVTLNPNALKARVKSRVSMHLCKMHTINTNDFIISINHVAFNLLGWLEYEGVNILFNNGLHKPSLLFSFNVDSTTLSSKVECLN